MKSFELVLKGHPDKVCDVVADTLSRHDIFNERTAIEVAWFNGKIFIGGEVSNYKKAIHDTEVLEIVKKKLLELGYNEPISVEIHLNEQSAEIKNVVGSSGAGDNGIFIAGYHRHWTPIIRKLKEIADHISINALKFNYRTDGKFIANFDVKNYTIKDFTLNIASYERSCKQVEFRNFVFELLNKFFDIKENQLFINPKGNWNKCGGFADSGVTGRKLACDNSLGLFRQGGGAFFGKDVSKADYSVPVYLQNKAQELVYEHNLTEIELHAYSIIGDEEIIIRSADGSFSLVESFEKIKDYAKNNPLYWFGLY